MSPACVRLAAARLAPYVSFPLALATAIGIEPGEEVQWELLERGELHLVRLNPPKPTTKKRAGK